MFNVAVAYLFKLNCILCKNVTTHRNNFYINILYTSGTYMTSPHAMYAFKIFSCVSNHIDVSRLLMVVIVHIV